MKTKTIIRQFRYWRNQWDKADKGMAVTKVSQQAVKENAEAAMSQLEGMLADNAISGDRYAQLNLLAVQSSLTERQIESISKHE